MQFYVSRSRLSVKPVGLRSAEYTLERVTDYRQPSPEERQLIDHYFEDFPPLELLDTLDAFISGAKTAFADQAKADLYVQYDGEKLVKVLDCDPRSFQLFLRKAERNARVQTAVAQLVEEKVPAVVQAATMPTPSGNSTSPLPAPPKTSNANSHGRVFRFAEPEHLTKVFPYRDSSDPDAIHCKYKQGYHKAPSPY